MNVESHTLAEMRKDISDIFYCGLKAVEPGAAIKRYCHLADDHLYIGNRVYDLLQFNNLFVIGAGKATAPMASALENILGKRITKGVISVKYNHVTELSNVRQIEAGHPIPDENGIKGTNAILDMAKDAGEDDLIVCLISGGGSALLPGPARGLTLQNKQDTMHVLLSCGAAIHEINTIRKHISQIKGGNLARIAYPATLISLILSDVVGDVPDIIASGPSVPDSSTFHDCMKIIDRYHIIKELPESIVKHIKEGMSGNIPENPKQNDRIFEKTHNLIVGSNMEAILSAQKKAESLNYNTIVLSSMIEGETRHVARVHTAIAREIRKTGLPVQPPACILSGGETTVTIKGKGKGGRNQEFALASAFDIAEEKNIAVFSGGTDGNDGPTDAAGAISDTDTIKKATELGLDPGKYLANNDSYHFFKQTGDLFITGPTNTNVMDLRIILVK